MIRRPPSSTLFPYPPFFRSAVAGDRVVAASAHREGAARKGDERGGRHRASSSTARIRRTASWIDSSVVRTDRKSTRLNSSHANISYAVFCLKKKKCRTKRTP